MHVVEDFMLGATHVRICDDKCVTPGEAEEILADLARRLKPHFAAKEMEARKAAQEERPVEGDIGKYGQRGAI